MLHTLTHLSLADSFQKHKVVSVQLTPSPLRLHLLLPVLLQFL